MTTICVKDRMIAADTRTTGGQYMAEGFKKVFQVDEDWIGLAGEVCAFPRFLEWYSGETDERPDIDGMEVIVMDKKGNVFIYEGDCVKIPMGKMGAIGSGARFAMGAMVHGATAEQAVKVASKLDEHTGPRVKSYTNKPKKVRAKKPS